MAAAHAPRGLRLPTRFSTRLSTWFHPRLHTWRTKLLLLLLGFGLVALSASDSAFAYFVSRGAPEIPPIADAGFVAGPVLIFLAALAPREPARAGAIGPRRSPFSEWAYLLMPYVPLVITGALVGTQLIAGRRLDAVEMWIGAAVVTAVVGRQLIAIVDKALAKLPEARFASMTEVRLALASVARASTTSTCRCTGATATGRPTSPTPCAR